MLVLTALVLALQAGVSVELHLFADTDHGFNIAAHSERLAILHWPDRLADWLREQPASTPAPSKP